METSPIARPLKDQVKNVPKPTMYNILLMVLEENKTAKGLSLAKIRVYVCEKYPDLKENFPNSRLGNAVRKGLETGDILRAKSSEELTGLKGYFKINKANSEKKLKEEKAKEKAKAKKKAEADGAKTKKVVKSKPKTERTVSVTKSKSPSKAKSLKVTAKVAKAGSGTPKKKSPKTKSPKTKKAAVAATPKLSKSAKAGAKAKTTSVKKLLKQPTKKVAIKTKTKK